jgi:hypothetical protein
VAETTALTEAQRKTTDDLADLVRRAQEGDKSTLPELRRLLQEQEAVDLLGGDLARRLERLIVEKAAGKNLLFKEALTRKLELLRAELAGPNPTPVERLLVERVLCCWLQLHDDDLRLHQQEAKLTLAQGEYWHRCRDRAHKRYLSAIKALATVRKLAVPVLQVNIARKQVNVAAPCGSSERATPPS